LPGPESRKAQVNRRAYPIGSFFYLKLARRLYLNLFTALGGEVHFNTFFYDEIFYRIDNVKSYLIISKILSTRKRRSKDAAKSHEITPKYCLF
jgi:NDP-sugar pyrophosphorylase family protein